tara:strand:- start:512 stop:802 length:291 start_codon:yes stop_codon:yes gene_type:complete
MSTTANVTRSVTAETGVELDAPFLNSLGVPTVTITSISATPITLKNYTVANIPTAGTSGRIAYCSNGNFSLPCLAVDNGTAWKIVALGPTIDDQQP